MDTIRTKHFFDRPEYREESWRLEEICCHSNSCEIPSGNADDKNSLEIVVEMIMKKKANATS